MSEVLPREATSCQPQDLFVELFAQAFGVDKVQLLSPEHPVRDIDGTMRYVDFALWPLARASPYGHSEHQAD